MREKSNWMTAFFVGLITATLFYCTFAWAQPWDGPSGIDVPYDSGIWSGGLCIAGPIDLNGVCDITTDADGDSRIEVGTDNQIGLYTNGALTVVVTTAGFTPGANMDLGIQTTFWRTVFSTLARIGTNNFTADAGYALHVSTGTATGGILSECTNAAGAGAAVDCYHNSASPANNDTICYRHDQANDSGGNETNFSSELTQIIDVTNGSEEGAKYFYVMENGMWQRYMALVGTDGTTSVVLDKISTHSGGIHCDGNETIHAGHLLFNGQSSIADTAQTGDATPRTGVVHKAENASHTATTAGNLPGANGCVCAGVGRRWVTFVSTVATAGKAITVNGNHDCAAITPSVYTEGVAFTCPNGAAVADCAISFRNAVNTTLPTGVELASCTTAGGAGCTDGVVAIKPLADTCDLRVTDDAAAEITQTESANGLVWNSISSGSATQRIAWIAAPTNPTSTGFVSPTVDGTTALSAIEFSGSIWVCSGGSCSARFSRSGDYFWSVRSDGGYGWASTTNANASAETKITRAAAGSIAFSGATVANGNIKLSTASTVKGQTLDVTSAVANCTFPAHPGAATCVTSAFIPLGASVIQVTGRQVTPGTDCTTCTAGANMGGGLDVNQYGDALECDVNDTLYTMATATATAMGTCTLAGGCTITMTAVGGTGVCDDGVAAWTVHYIAATAATSD